VDDGSTADTAKCLSQYDNLTVINQHNRGVSAARNRGIESSNGDLIAFLDSDDIWLPEKLSVQVDFFMRNSKAEICQTQEIWIRDGKRLNPGRRHVKTSGLFFERSLALCLVSPSAVMIRKRLLSTVGLFDETLPACEDYDLWLRVNATIPIFLIDEPLVIKRGGHTDQEDNAIDAYNQFLLVCRENGDSISMKLLEEIIDDEQAHFNYFDSVQDHIDKLGDVYLSKIAGTPSSTGLQAQGFTVTNA